MNRFQRLFAGMSAIIAMAAFFAASEVRADVRTPRFVDAIPVWPVGCTLERNAFFGFRTSFVASEGERVKRPPLQFKKEKVMNRNKLNCFADVPADEYHQAARDGKFLSSHLLGDFRKTPKLYRMKMTGEIEPSESAALKGEAPLRRNFWFRKGRRTRKRTSLSGSLRRRTASGRRSRSV